MKHQMTAFEWQMRTNADIRLESVAFRFYRVIQLLITAAALPGSS